MLPLVGEPALGPQGKIRVMHVILSLEIGGMERVVIDLVKQTDSQAFFPIVACLNALGPGAEELGRLGIPVVKVAPMVSAWSFIYPANLIQLIRRYRCDVVHVHSGCWHKAAIAAWFCGVSKVIYTDHGRSSPDSRVVMTLDRLIAPITSHVVAVSDSLGEYMSAKVGIRADKISVIINGIDVARFPASDCSSQRSGNLRIGIIARLAPVKDIATLVRAMAIVHQREPLATLSIIGDGPERNALETLVRELDLHKTVIFHGFRLDIPSALEEIDVFVLSSLSEGTSITLLEAMASGKPIVATKVGGNPALVEQGVNGLLVVPGEPESLAQALLNLCQDAEMRRTMAAANAAMVRERYSIQAMARSYELLYRQG